jgi:DNA end-binding protein Ku
MVGRPYWSGQLKVSLVSFGIQLFPATTSSTGVAFHQIDRTTNQRVRHLKVVGDNEPIENADIVKGYEYSKGKYLVVEPEEIKKLRVETLSVVELTQFIDAHELSPALYEKPYFVVPEQKESVDAFAVVRAAMAQANKIGIGEIAFGGREHLIAIAVPPEPNSRGMMAYTLRYAEEMRDSDEYFSDIQEAKIDKRELALANELIRAHSAPFEHAAFKDDYEAALRKLIEAKQANVPLPVETERIERPKVVSLMDALRRSVSQSKQDADRRPARAQAPKKGPVSVKAGKRAHRAA